ncbi:MAG: bifunctional glutamate N-acetyltransferase/amino-acid acetyltransferase ArgJ [Elusimicrobiota bacterium]|nr:bifunctional glutamate N-acetyltransferase/amino-acid acetyltransferase ArgJ [Elusimicrobiota bacterium]
MTNTIPKGFRFAGVYCGISNSKKQDLALFYSTAPCITTGLFTQNLIPAAPVIVSKKKLLKDATRIQAIIANSGCANAATGKHGIKDAEEMCSLTAKCLGLSHDQVLVASTGVIGTYLPMKKISDGIKKLTTLLAQPARQCCRNAFSSRSFTCSPIDAIKAIMTTDTVPKVYSSSFRLPSSVVTIWGCAKGSGMIHPNLGTLLCFTFTDVNISEKLLDIAVKSAVDKSFNCLSIDGDTSTNDTVFVLANGLAGNKKISSRSDPRYKKFSNVLNDTFSKLAQMIVSDGEGVTKLIKIKIKQAKTFSDAKKIAVAIAKSVLVKTAIFGADPNWGRIVAAIGNSQANFNPEKIDIYINNFLVAKNSTAVELNPARLNAIKKSIEKNSGKLTAEFTTPDSLWRSGPVEITIKLHSGKEQFEYYTTDLSYDYVRINSSYRT